MLRQQLSMAYVESVHVWCPAFTDREPASFCVTSWDIDRGIPCALLYPFRGVMLVRLDRLRAIVGSCVIVCVGCAITRVA